MAKIFNIFTLMVILALASRVVVATIEIVDSIAPSPEDAPFEDPAPGSAEVFPPEPSPTEIEYLQECIKTMTEECAEVIFQVIFKDQKTVISNDCCHKLVTMGRPCHDNMVKLVVESPDFKGNASITVPKSVAVWNNCVKVA